MTRSEGSRLSGGCGAGGQAISQSAQFSIAIDRSHGPAPRKPAPSGVSTGVRADGFEVLRIYREAHKMAVDQVTGPMNIARYRVEPWMKGPTPQAERVLTVFTYISEVADQPVRID